MAMSAAFIPARSGADGLAARLPLTAAAHRQLPQAARMLMHELSAHLRCWRASRTTTLRARSVNLSNISSPPHRAAGEATEVLLVPSHVSPRAGRRCARECRTSTTFPADSGVHPVRPGATGQVYPATPGANAHGVPRTAVTSANGAPSRPAGRVQPCRRFHVSRCLARVWPSELMPRTRSPRRPGDDDQALNITRSGRQLRRPTPGAALSLYQQLKN